MEASNYFKEYNEFENGPSHILVLEVEGEVENALDLRSTIEKLEFPGLGLSAIYPLESFAERFN
jgi:hypothetical protein